jgi:prepilin-type N-terminal cleavage/methylation domain-containing protein
VLRSSRGFALTEVVVAVVILALILAAIPPVLVLILHSQFQWTEQRVAESLTRNQIEYIKAVGYIEGNVTYPKPAYTAVPTPDETYDVIIIAQPIDSVTKEDLPDGEDEDVQKITIKILHGDKLVLQTVNYKVDRLGIRAI